MRTYHIKYVNSKGRLRYKSLLGPVYGPSFWINYLYRIAAKNGFKIVSLTIETL